LDTRLGCFGVDVPADVEAYMVAIDGIMKSFPEMMMSFPLWGQYYKTFSPVIYGFS
jgi:hypothetical protein